MNISSQLITSTESVKSFKLHEKSLDRAFTVSQISMILDQTIKSNIGQVSIRGEISNLKISSSGHIYFCLKDSKAVINAICWKNIQQTVAIDITDGMEIICTGNISIYSERSSYQIIVDKLEICGIGSLLTLLEKRKKQLANEGLFLSQYKKKLPIFPKVIAVITSLEGAVVRDIMHRVRDRCPIHILLWGTPVQGQGAAEKIAAGIAAINRIDDQNIILPIPALIIIARGGGSIEDLWPFNEEIVARAAFESKIPIISAIGHETDYTILDLVADIRAPTPTASIEIALPQKKELIIRLKQLWQKIDNIILLKIQKLTNNLISIENRTHKYREKHVKMIQNVESFTNLLKQNLRCLLLHKTMLFHEVRLSFNILQRTLSQKNTILENYIAHLNKAMKKILDKKSDNIFHNCALLESYDHKNVLKRGFALIRQNDQLLKLKNLAINHKPLEIELYDGKLIAYLHKKLKNNKKKNIKDSEINTEEKHSVLNNKNQLILFK